MHLKELYRVQTVASLKCQKEEFGIILDEKGDH